MPAWEDSDLRAIQEYKNRLDQIDSELANIAAGKIYNKSKVERLQKEKADIEVHLKNANYAGKDPEVEKARKNVRKVISETIAKIRKLEEHCNYNHKPISSHLNRYIKTGTSCSYTVPEENAPLWKF